MAFLKLNYLTPLHFKGLTRMDDTELGGQVRRSVDGRRPAGVLGEAEEV